MKTDDPELPRASRIETLGAWLGLWTPPRDVVVPPVPWRKVAAGAGVLALLAVGAALLVAPAIDDAKDEGAAERQAAEDARAAARRARQREEQRPVTGALPAGPPLERVEALIGRDARRRFAADGSPARCDLAPGADATSARVVYDCLVTVREIVGGGEQEGARGVLGIPYRAVIERDAGRYAFCKANPRPGEAALPRPEDVVGLPAPCRK